MSNQVKWEEVKEGDKFILKNEFVTDAEGKRHNVIGSFVRLLPGGDVLVEVPGGLQKQMAVHEIMPVEWKEIWE